MEKRRWYGTNITCVRHGSAPHGVAAVELAVCLPLLVMLIMSSIHASSMIYLNQSLTVSAYEGVRSAIQVDGTDASSAAAAQAILTSRGIQNPIVTITPSNVNQLARGTTIAVTVSAPADGNSAIPPGFYQGQTLSATCTMVRE